MFELHNWLKKTYIDSKNDINLWESFLPLYMFSQIYYFPNLVMWFQAKYNPLQRIIVTQNGDIMISIIPKIINKMPLIFENDSLSFFSTATLIDLYHKLTFPQRAQIFEIFFPEYVELPKRNPPYPASMFSKRAKHITSLISCLVGYQRDQWVDEVILGYLSIFSKENKPPFIYNYIQFLVEDMHEKLMNITTKGVFKYSSMLAHVFIFLWGDMLSIVLRKQDD